MSPRRHTRTRFRTTVAALVALAATPALAGCGGDDTPDGWTRVETGWLALDVPDGWVETGRVTDQWTTGWQDAEGDDATLQLLASPTLGYYRADVGRGVVLAGAQVGGLPGFSVVEQTEPVDTDSLELNRTEFTYDSDGDGTYSGILWVASDPETEQAVAVQVTGPELDPDIVDTIESSIAVLDTDATPTGS
jgi:hypothetical protein